MEEERCLFGGMLCYLYMCTCSVEHVVQHTVHVRMITQWITILNKNSQSTQLQGRWGPMPPLQLPSWAEWSLLQASPHSTHHSFQGMSTELTQSVPAIKRFSSTWHTYLCLPPSPFLSVPPFPSLPFPPSDPMSVESPSSHSYYSSPWGGGVASVKSGQTHPRSVPDSSDGLVTKKPKIEGELSVVAVLQGAISTMNSLGPCA